MTETTATPPSAQASEQQEPVTQSQVPMILWCGGLALAHVVYWLVNAANRLDGKDAAGVLGALTGMALPVVGYGFAAWRFGQLGRGERLPNLWGLRLFSALVFVLIVIAAVGTGLQLHRAGLRVGQPGLGLPVALGLGIICIFTLVAVTPLFILDRRAKCQVLDEVASRGSPENEDVDRSRRPGDGGVPSLS